MRVIILLVIQWAVSTSMGYTPFELIQSNTGHGADPGDYDLHGKEGQPVSRYMAVMASLGSKLYMHGGVYRLTVAKPSDDLWSFDTITKRWKWLAGTNPTIRAGVLDPLAGPLKQFRPSYHPGTRIFHGGFTANNDFFIFGGSTGLSDYRRSDLWRYREGSGWSHWAGPSGDNQPGSYGSLRTYHSTNWPGGRVGFGFCQGSNGFWIFGGAGVGEAATQGLLSDLWHYDPTEEKWAFFGGSRFVDDYSIRPYPRHRSTLACRSDGKLYLYGGSTDGFTKEIRDLWLIDPTSNPTTFTFLAGDQYNRYTCNHASKFSIYGTLNIPSSSNYPGARQSMVSWTDNENSFFLYGGFSCKYSGYGAKGDVWRYKDGMWTWIDGEQGFSYSSAPLDASTNDWKAYCSTHKCGAPAVSDMSISKDSYGQVFAFGGLNQDSSSQFRALNNMYVANLLDFDSLTYTTNTLVQVPDTAPNNIIINGTTYTTVQVFNTLGGQQIELQGLFIVDQTEIKLVDNNVQPARRLDCPVDSVASSMHKLRCTVPPGVGYDLKIEALFAGTYSVMHQVDSLSYPAPVILGLYPEPPYSNEHPTHVVITGQHFGVQEFDAIELMCSPGGPPQSGIKTVLTEYMSNTNLSVILPPMDDVVGLQVQVGGQYSAKFFVEYLKPFLTQVRFFPVPSSNPAAFQIQAFGENFGTSDSNHVIVLDGERLTASLVLSPKHLVVPNYIPSTGCIKGELYVEVNGISSSGQIALGIDSVNQAGNTAVQDILFPNTQDAVELHFHGYIPFEDVTDISITYGSEGSHGPWSCSVDQSHSTQTEVICTSTGGVSTNLPMNLMARGVPYCSDVTASFPKPALTNTQDFSGPISGNRQVVLLGSNFGPAAHFEKNVQVNACNGEATKAEWISHSEIKCTVPIACGDCAITVFIGGQEAKGPISLAFHFDPPIILKVEPSGTTAGKISGRNFGPKGVCTPEVLVNGIQLGAALIQHQSDSSIIVSHQPSQDDEFSVNVDGQSSNKFYYGTTESDKIVIYSISPLQDPFPTSGNTVITVKGVNFGTKFDTFHQEVHLVNNERELECPSVDRTGVNDDVLVATMPPGSGTSYHVVVHVRGVAGLPSVDLISYDPPKIESLVAETGDHNTENGFLVTISGQNFGPNLPLLPKTIASFGGHECDVTTWVSHSELLCKLGPGVGKGLSARVSVCGQSVEQLETSISYDPAQITSATPPVMTVPTTGGQEVVIDGKNFGEIDAEAFVGQFQATVVRYMTAHRSILIKIPAGIGENLPIRIDVGGQRGSDSSASYTVTYETAVVTSIECLELPTQGGKLDANSGDMLKHIGVCSIKGRNFGPKTTSNEILVNIGSNTCDQLTWVDHTLLACVVPEGSGKHKVSVTVGNRPAEIETPDNTLTISYDKPKIDSIDPPDLLSMERTVVEITGANFGSIVDRIQVTLSLPFGSGTCGEISLLKAHSKLSCRTPLVPDGQQHVQFTVIVSGISSDAFEIDTQSVSIPPQTKNLMHIICYAEVGLLALMAIVIGLLRENKHIKASSITFCFVILLGAALCILSTRFLNEPLPSCCAQFILMCIGFTLMLGSLILKNYRILKIFHSSNSAKIVNIPNLKLLGGLAVFLVIDIVLLAPVTNYQVKNGMCVFGKDIMAPVIIMGIWKLILLIGGVVIAWMSRMITLSEFNERVSIGFAIYNIAVGVIILFPLSIIMSQTRETVVTAYVVKVLSVEFITAMTVVFFFSPKFYQVYVYYVHKDVDYLSRQNAQISNRIRAGTTSWDKRSTGGPTCGATTFLEEKTEPGGEKKSHHHASLSIGKGKETGRRTTK